MDSANRDDSDRAGQGPGRHPAANGGPEVPRLEQIYFYLTTGCNLACRHCWLAPPLERGRPRHPVLPERLLTAAVDEGLPLGLRAVKLTGGEPLLHPGFHRLLAVIRDRGLALNLETNGVLLTDDTARALGAMASGFVSVSIDGARAETHDRMRGMPGAFRAACRAVTRLAERGVRTQVIMTLTAANRDQVGATVRLAEDLGAAGVKFNVVQPTARGRTLREQGETLGVAETLDIARRVQTELGPATGLDLFFDVPPAFRPLGRMAAGDGCGVCGILNIVGVIATGEWALCGIGTQVPELAFGRVGRDRLAEVWHGHPTLAAIRRGLPDRLEGICGRCLMRSACRGGCVAQTVYRTGRLWAPFWFCEAAEAAGCFPVSRTAASAEAHPGGKPSDRGADERRKAS